MLTLRTWLAERDLSPVQVQSKKSRELAAGYEYRSFPATRTGSIQMQSQIRMLQVGFVGRSACALSAKSMHAEPPLQGNYGPFCWLKQCDQKQNGKGNDYRHECCNRKACFAGQGDDEWRQKMSSYQDREISRKVIRLLMGQV